MTRDGPADPLIPRSGAEGILWPAVPQASDAIVLALLHQLQQTEWWTPEELRRHQFAQAERLIAHAFDTVPFYRNRLKDVVRLPAGGMTEEAWRAIPILTRVEAQANAEALVSRHIPETHGSVHDERTSGSTGRPVSFKATGLMSAFQNAFNLRRMIWHKRDFSAKAARIISMKQPDVALPPDGAAEPSWAPVFPTGPSVILNLRSSIEEQLAWLVREKPAYLLTYPGNVEGLARLCQETGTRLDSLRGIATMSEGHDPELHETCRRVWGVPLMDGYSSIETGPIATQCPDHIHYHIDSENVIVEILDANDDPCLPGDMGKVIVTSLNNFATPFIRYDLGDIAIPGKTSCSCGRGLPVIERVLGRVRNLLTYPDGRQTKPRINEGLADQPAILQFQGLQPDPETLEIRLVVVRPLSGEEEDRIRTSLTDYLGYPFAIKLTYVDEIERAPSGKFEDFRSDVTTKLGGS